jgi:tetratricopeptide (TPR) repeat protein
LIRKENANAAKINRLIVEFHGALDQHDWATGASLLQQLIALDPNRWEFYQNLGTIQANQMHYQESIESFAKGVEVAEKLLPSATDPAQTKSNIGDMLVSEGDAYNRLGQLGDAVKMYTRAAGLSSRPATANFHACNALYNNGKLEGAVEACNLAIQQDPSQWEFYQVLGGALNTLGKAQEAVETYNKGVEAARKAVAEKPDSAQARAGLGQMLNSKGNLLVHEKRYEEALAAFTEAVEVSAYPAMPYFNLCATHYNLGRQQDALSACDKAIQADPTMSDAYYIKAAVLFGQGKLEHGLYQAPPGTREALNLYLQYAPFGEHASAVRSMIDKLDTPVEEKYHPAKK